MEEVAEWEIGAKRTQTTCTNKDAGARLGVRLGARHATTEVDARMRMRGWVEGCSMRERTGCSEGKPTARRLTAIRNSPECWHVDGKPHMEQTLGVPRLPSS